MFFTARFSTTITWFSLTILRDSLCRKSSRTLAIFAWTLATASLALHRLLVVLSFLRDNLRCFRFRLRSCFLRCRGFWYFDPSEVTAKSSNPRSIPIAFPYPPAHLPLACAFTSRGRVESATRSNS
jgi:hypothetical protein